MTYPHVRAVEAPRRETVPEKPEYESHTPRALADQAALEHLWAISSFYWKRQRETGTPGVSAH